MNSNPKNRNKGGGRPPMTSHNNNSNLQNVNNKPQMRQKSLSDTRSGDGMTPEGVYRNARVVHCTTSLVGCLVHIETKDGNKYEGVLRTFSPDFELVIDYVTKIDANYVPIVGSNIGTLLASLQDNNAVSQRDIFQFADVVKIHAINVDLNYATNKGHMMTDTEISRFDSRSLSRDKELVPWDGAGDSGDEFPDLDDHNNGGLSSGGAQNGWAAEDMFRINEDKFQVKSDFDTSLGQYTMALPEVVDEEKEKIARKIAESIEGDQSRQARLSKENDGEDDDGKYSDVVRPAPNDNRNPDHRRDNRPNSRKPNSQLTNSGYSMNSSGGPPGARSGGRSGPSGPPLSTSTTFHGNKNPNAGYKYSPNSNMGSGGGPYKSYRDDNYGQSGGYYKNDNPHDERDSPHSNPQPQRPILDGRRQPQMQSKRRDDSDSKYSNDYKSPAPETTPHHKNSPPPGIRTEPSSHPKPNANNSANSGANNSLSAMTSSSANKSKSPVNAVVADTTTPVNDKSDAINEQLSDNKELRDSRETAVRDSSANDKPSAPDKPDVTADPTPGGPATGGAPETEIAKKSTLNPNAKTFTPRMPMSSPLSTSATPPSVSSTPSSTVSIPSSGPMTHQAMQPVHSMGQPSQMTVTQQHPQQHRYPNPSLVQIQPQYNVIPHGLTLPLGANPYLMTAANMTAMGPTFAQSNAGQQRNYRGKAPQQQYAHAVRHEYQQQQQHPPIAAAVTGHPVLATAPMTGPQSMPTVSYGQTMVNNAPPQHMYHQMYTQFQPRMNLQLQQHSGGMQMAMPQPVQYDPSQIQHIYATANAVQLQHLVSQAHQHMTNSGPHSGHSTPQSATPTTPLHGGPAPSPVHHQPNQPPTPTPQQTIMYTSPQGAGHQGSGGYPNIVLLPSGHAMAGGHHGGGHGAQLHAAHQLSHNSTSANHHSGNGPQSAILPVQLIAGSNAANYNNSAGV